jgi:alkylation response protein AidB-like acyl-CoA dehydrogenase
MISFELSDEQKMIRDTVAAFANEQIRPAARPADESGEIPADLIGKAWDLARLSLKLMAATAILAPR